MSAIGCILYPSKVRTRSPGVAKWKRKVKGAEGGGGSGFPDGLGAELSTTAAALTVSFFSAIILRECASQALLMFFCSREKSEGGGAIEGTGNKPMGPCCP